MFTFSIPPCKKKYDICDIVKTHKNKENCKGDDSNKVLKSGKRTFEG